MEHTQQRDFNVHRHSHIILHCVQCSQHQIEETHCVAQLCGETLNDHGETASKKAKVIRDTEEMT
jgi:hypothetical protein